MRVRPEVCKRCGNGPEPAKPISYRGLCVDCQFEKISKGILEMATREGEAWENYVRANAKKWTAELLKIKYPVHCANDDCGPYAGSHLPAHVNGFCDCYCHVTPYIVGLPKER